MDRQELLTAFEAEQIDQVLIDVIRQHIDGGMDHLDDLKGLAIFGESTLEKFKAAFRAAYAAGRADAANQHLPAPYSLRVSRSGS